LGSRAVAAPPAGAPRSPPLRTVPARRKIKGQAAKDRRRSGGHMTAYNIVRFRVKPGYEQKFIDAHKNAKPNFKGFVEGAMVKTGEHTFCFVAKWSNFKRIADARAGMIAMLNSFRDCLDDLGGGMGVTDPVSGEAVLTLKLAAPKRAKPKKKPAAKKKKK
jgi:hypothetical protein